jgi:hypothetical protein
MNRRSFIKGLIALASAPAIGKYVNIFKTEGAREGIEQVASQGVDFFNMVIKKVMDEGTLVKEEDRISTFKHPDRPDITVDVDQTTGSSSVYFDTDEGTKAVGEIQKTMDETTGGRTVEELFEQEEIYGPTGRDAQEGISGGITNLEEFLKRKRGFAMGGRVGMFRGGVPKGLQAAMRAIMSKYGDDAITTADRAPQPEKTIQEQIMDFNARTKSGKRSFKGVEIKDPTFDETLPFDNDAEKLAEIKMSNEAYDMEKARGTEPKLKDIFTDEVKIKEAVDDIFPTGDYKMDAQMAAESFVENNPQAFNNMLFDDLDQRTQMKVYDVVLTEIQSNMAKMRELKKLSKPEKTLGAMKAGKGIDMSDPDIAAEFTRFMQESDPSGFKDVEEKVELMNFNPKGRKKNADGGSVDGDVSLTVIKIPDISESGVESLFKRR